MHFGAMLKKFIDNDNLARRTLVRMLQPRSPVGVLDPVLIWSAILLLLFGLVMVYSASIAFTAEREYYFLIRHGVFLAVGVTLGLLAFRVPMALWQHLAPWLFMVGVVLLVVVLIPQLGHVVKGARRWISLGVVNVQPSEFVKLFVALYAADYTVRKLDVMGNLVRGFLPMLVAILLVGLLLLFEPDFGAFVVIAAIAFGVLFLGGLNIRALLLLLSALALVCVAVMIWGSSYRRERLFGFMDPWSNPSGWGYQPIHAMIAFERGGWFGAGLGASVEKLFYLPEPHTDFLFSVIAEELGFAGVFTVVMLFGLLVHRAFVIGCEAIVLGRCFAGLVAQAIGLWMGGQAFINMGMNMSVLPTKGLTLPLMSFGGSGLVANCLALAILLRVDWEVRQLKCGGGGG
ncbi:MAG: putative lipid II flippase FtsW [Azoarcus sp.]|nr:putative lipid II flippase FtsW [Azoarcus sp.]